MENLERENLEVESRDYYLWVDDCKNPEEELLCEGKLVCWARDVDQAIFYVKHNSIPKIMFLDYDLGGYDSIGRTNTVMKFLRWMKREEVSCDFDYKVISWNPDGCKEIIAFMTKWKNNIGNH